MERDALEILDAIPDGLVVVGSDGRVEYLNAEACRMLETSAEAARGKPVAQLATALDLGSLAGTVLETGRPRVQDDRRLPRRLDADLVVDVAAAPLWDPGRRPSGVAVALRDRTIRRSLASRAAERELLTAYGTIASGIAHEVKNPLGGIRGAAEIMASRTEDAKLRDAAALIVREVDRIRTLVDELMVFQGGEALRLAPTNIHRVLDDVIDLLSMDPLATGVKLERRFDPSIPEMRADADRLVQVFLNLGRNALQALDGQGRLWFETRMALDHRLPTHGGGSLPTVQVSVGDDGPGIEPAVLERLGTPFFTTRSRGTGLGLATSLHWVAHHAGELRIESEPGAGTRVRVALPVSGPPREEAT